MTSVVHSFDVERSSPRTIVGGGVLLGVATAIGVAVFAALSRGMEGTAETLVQSILILAGGSVVAFFPAMQVQPRSVDSIAWAALVGLLGALTFTVLDTAILRPLNTYHWSWDAIGGGSGWWYVPVWWMGSGVLAWFGGWITANSAARSGGQPNILMIAVQSVIVGGVVVALLVLTSIGPFTAAIVALGYSVGLLARALAGSVFGRG